MADPSRLDALDTRLIALLSEDGRKGNRELADELGVSEGTIRSRIRRLTDAGVLRIVALTDIEAGGAEFLVMFSFQVEGRPVRDVAQDLGELPGAVGISIVSGQYDIVGSFTARGKRELTHLLTSGFANIGGIAAIESSVSLEALKSNTGWVGVVA